MAGVSKEKITSLCSPSLILLSSLALLLDLCFSVEFFEIPSGEGFVIDIRGPVKSVLKGNYIRNSRLIRDTFLKATLPSAGNYADDLQGCPSYFGDFLRYRCKACGAILLSLARSLNDWTSSILGVIYTGIL